MQPPLKIFVVYAHEDRPVRDKVLRQLRPLADNGEIDLWGDHEIRPGAIWEEEIRQRLSDSSLILLLVSDDFFASDYIRRVELRTALDLHARGAAQVLPIIVRHCGWVDMPALSRLQVLPPEGRPILSKEWDSPDEPYLKVYEGVKASVRDLRRRHAAALPDNRQQDQTPDAPKHTRRKWVLPVFVLALALLTGIASYLHFASKSTGKSSSGTSALEPAALNRDTGGTQTTLPSTSNQDKRGIEPKGTREKAEDLPLKTPVQQREIKQAPNTSPKDSLALPFYDRKLETAEGMTRVAKGRRQTFMDSNGRWIGQWYDDAENFHNGRAFVTKGSRSFWIDKTGHCVEGCN